MTDQADATRPGGIFIRDLTRQFGSQLAVDHVTLEIGEGEIFGLIGPNGAGKSTLVKMLTTLLPPSSGTALIAGVDILQNPAEVRRHIGYVPQLLSADGSLSGYENMLLSARLYGISRIERRQRITQALARMGLADVADHLAGHYSGGMVRRLEIAQSMLHLPAVLFLDEPTVGLDPSARDAVWHHVLDLKHSFGMTIVVTSHHMDEINEFCERIALINRGRIVAVGTPQELKEQVGPGATLDDVFINLVGAAAEPEAAASYKSVREARRAARAHG